MNSTTTPLDPRVREAMVPLLDAPADGPGARETKRIADAARAGVAMLCGADPEEIVLTSGGTESCNLALKGPALWSVSRGETRRRVLALATEHTSVLYPLRTLGRLGCDAREIPVDRDGTVDLDALEDLLGTPTSIVSIAPVNAETGTLQPVDRVVSMARERGALVHVDACLSAAYAPIDVGAMDVDLASFSAHKIGGPKGAGALFVREGVRLLPLIEGGVEEGGRRGGAAAAMSISGLGGAARIHAEQGAQDRARYARLSARLEAGLRGVAGVLFNGGARRAAGLVNVSVPGVDGEALITKLSLRGIAVSTGSSCFQETGKPSHVLLAMGMEPERARGSVLFALGRATRDEEIDRVIEVFGEVVASLRALGPARAGPGSSGTDRR